MFNSQVTSISSQVVAHLYVGPIKRVFPNIKKSHNLFDGLSYLFFPESHFTTHRKFSLLILFCKPFVRGHAQICSRRVPWHGHDFDVIANSCLAHLIAWSNDTTRILLSKIVWSTVLCKIKWYLYWINHKKSVYPTMVYTIKSRSCKGAWVGCPWRDHTSPHAFSIIHAERDPRVNLFS